MSSIPPIPIQRRRLGWIKAVFPDRGFGFIEAEDFQGDVFFQFRVWDGGTKPIPDEGRVVEFEIDDLLMKEDKKLRAIVVRPTDRPMGRVLTPRDAPHLNARHHPRARRRKPTWR
jgi:cold shock CspA family protein